MERSSALLRKIPKMDALLAHPDIKALMEGQPEGLALRALREAVEEVRAGILAGQDMEPAAEDIALRAKKRLGALMTLRQRKVINATGVLLHTNLGRALLAPFAAEAMREAALSYTTLEFNCESGERGDRYLHVEGVLTELLGAQSALVVNNNAAAVLLMLSSLAKGREVVVSRGELVEIGGSFRVPAVMEQSGCTLREVGTTNKTHPADYLRAIGENTAALLKVHTSNYRVIGFTEEVPLAQLARIAHEAGLPLLHDLGSGSLLPLAPFGLRDEPTALESIRDGADVVCFSGDKLLGGPQAGIIAGKKQYLAPMKKHPLLRALRVDKITLSALEATLLLYRDPALATREIPLYRMLAEPVRAVRARCARLMELLEGLPQCELAVVDTEGQVGGGSAPGETFPSAALALRAATIRPDRLHKALLCAPTPIVGRIEDDRLLLDMRAVPEAALGSIAEALLHAIPREKQHA